MNCNSPFAKFMGKMMQWLNCTCKDTSASTSEMLDHSLPLAKRWRLKFHLAMCKVCRYYLDQMKAIHIVSKKMGCEDAPAHQDIKMPEDCKERLKETLKNSK